MPVALSLALAGALALGAYAGSVVLVLAVALTQGLLVAGWHRAVAAPGAVGGVVLCSATALSADVLLLRDDPRPLGPVSGVLGLTMGGVLLHQLARNPRDRVTASMTATAALAVVVVLASMYVAAPQTRRGADLVVVVVAAAAASRLADLLPLPSVPREAVAAALAAAAGLAGGTATDIGAGSGLVLGLAAGGAAGAAAAFARRVPRPDVWTSGALPVALAGPVAYLLGGVVLG